MNPYQVSSTIEQVPQLKPAKTLLGLDYNSGGWSQLNRRVQKELSEDQRQLLCKGLDYSWINPEARCRLTWVFIESEGCCAITGARLTITGFTTIKPWRVDPYNTAIQPVFVAGFVYHAFKNYRMSAREAREAILAAGTSARRLRRWENDRGMPLGGRRLSPDHRRLLRWEPPAPAEQLELWETGTWPAEDSPEAVYARLQAEQAEAQIAPLSDDQQADGVV